jgi:hypothetical protein
MPSNLPARVCAWTLSTYDVKLECPPTAPAPPIAAIGEFGTPRWQLALMLHETIAVREAARGASRHFAVMRHTLRPAYRGATAKTG